MQTVEELIALSEQYATRLAAITSYDDRIVKLTERRDAQYNKVKKQAAVLTKARTEIAREVEQQMAARLIPLGIPNVRFQVEMGLKKNRVHRARILLISCSQPTKTERCKACLLLRRVVR